ncbi:MAG: sulfatase-like hydrolase/transferase, partial [Planctomycetes bacterium]|nr:sulfatase-like hydrolase/transferase [Planctomycetota bacterium]
MSFMGSPCTSRRLLLLGLLLGPVGACAADPPNVVLIVVDDAGYADFGCQGSKTMATPHIDALARRGVVLKQGYVTASVCSPSRAGLLTGRYPQRFGHEFNLLVEHTPDAGMSVKERTLADYLSERGY